jgi:GNAT superfamily N-acetyltransferase
LRREDIPPALRIQSETYPAFLRENEDAFASRLDVALPYCLAATLGDVLVGYLLAHGWPSQSPPAVGAILPHAAPGEILYIHDLAVASGERGLGVGRMLVASAFETAARDGLQGAELIAVEGAASYWRKLGFVDATCSEEVAPKVTSYGSEARWLRRSIP